MATQEKKHFDVTGRGKLKPGMSKQDALATGELAATGAGRTGTCEDFRYAGSPASDARQLADDVEFEKRYEAAHAEKLAASAEAGARATELIAEAAKRIAARAEARETHGGVVSASEEIRLILPPPGASAAGDVGAGATIEQFIAAYPNAAEKVVGTLFEVPVADRQRVVLEFRFTDGKLTKFLLRDGVECL